MIGSVVRRNVYCHEKLTSKRRARIVSSIIQRDWGSVTNRDAPL